MLPIVDPDLYRQLSEPFMDERAAEGALEEFFLRLRDLRVELGLPDVHCTVMVNVKTDIGVKTFMTMMHNGDQSNCLYMTAWAYGVEKKEHDRRIAEVLE